MGAFTEIRAALESEIGNITGIPAATQRAWENARFEPTVGIPWVQMQLNRLNSGLLCVAAAHRCCMRACLLSPCSIHRRRVQPPLKHSQTLSDQRSQ